MLIVLINERILLFQPYTIHIRLDNIHDHTNNSFLASARVTFRSRGTYLIKLRCNSDGAKALLCSVQ